LSLWISTAIEIHINTNKGGFYTAWLQVVRINATLWDYPVAAVMHTSIDLAGCGVASAVVYLGCSSSTVVAGPVSLVA
jgi:hypothetical protein